MVYPMIFQTYIFHWFKHNMIIHFQHGSAPRMHFLIQSAKTSEGAQRPQQRLAKYLHLQKSSKPWACVFRSPVRKQTAVQQWTGSMTAIMSASWGLVLSLLLLQRIHCLSGRPIIKLLQQPLQLHLHLPLPLIHFQSTVHILKKNQISNA